MVPYLHQVDDTKNQHHHEVLPEDHFCGDHLLYINRISTINHQQSDTKKYQAVSRQLKLIGVVLLKSISSWYCGRFDRLAPRTDVIKNAIKTMFSVQHDQNKYLD